jgi:hypothetical protein
VIGAALLHCSEDVEQVQDDDDRDRDADHPGKDAFHVSNS